MQAAQQRPSSYRIKAELPAPQYSTPNNNYLSGDGKSHVWADAAYYTPSERSFIKYPDYRSLPSDSRRDAIDFQSEDQWVDFMRNRDQPSGGTYHPHRGTLMSRDPGLTLNAYASGVDYAPPDMLPCALPCSHKDAWVAPIRKCLGDEHAFYRARMEKKYNINQPPVPVFGGQGDLPGDASKPLYDARTSTAKEVSFQAGDPTANQQPYQTPFESYKTMPTHLSQEPCCKPHYIGPGQDPKETTYQDTYRPPPNPNAGILPTAVDVQERFGDLPAPDRNVNFGFGGTIPDNRFGGDMPETTYEEGYGRKRCQPGSTFLYRDLASCSARLRQGNIGAGSKVGPTTYQFDYSGRRPLPGSTYQTGYPGQETVLGTYTDHLPEGCQPRQYNHMQGYTGKCKLPPLSNSNRVPGQQGTAFTGYQNLPGTYNSVTGPGAHKYQTNAGSRPTTYDDNYQPPKNHQTPKLLPTVTHSSYPGDGALDAPGSGTMNSVPGCDPKLISYKQGYTGQQIQPGSCGQNLRDDCVRNEDFPGWAPNQHFVPGDQPHAPLPYCSTQRQEKRLYQELPHTGRFDAGTLKKNSFNERWAFAQP